MAYTATVLPVMIASPGDIFEEREVIREVVHNWNYVHSLKRQLVLMPTGWETHSSPELGGRAQELINVRVLEKCDILVGVFWTRIGTPTGESESGTVEEIEKHVAAGKPALIYFSSRPAAPDSIDQDQYQKLKDFRENCKQKGLIEFFDNPLDLRDKFTRQLQICLNGNEYIQKIIPPELGEDDNQGIRDAIDIYSFEDIRISKEAAILLKAASKDSHGSILKIAVLGGRYIQAGDSKFGGQGGRESARWEYALNELIHANLVVAQGYKDEVFELTHLGWKFADTLPD